MENEFYEKLDEDIEILENANIAGAGLELVTEDKLLSKDGYMLAIDPTENQQSGFYLDPYVKVYDGPTYFKAKNCLRVHIIDGRCEHHKDEKGGLPISRGVKQFLKNNLTQAVYDQIFDILKKYYKNIPGAEQQIDALYAAHDEPMDFNKIWWGGGKFRNER